MMKDDSCLIYLWWKMTLRSYFYEERWHRFRGDSQKMIHVWSCSLSEARENIQQIYTKLNSNGSRLNGRDANCISKWHTRIIFFFPWLMLKYWSFTRCMLRQTDSEITMCVKQAFQQFCLKAYTEFVFQFNVRWHWLVLIGSSSKCEDLRNRMRFSCVK